MSKTSKRLFSWSSISKTPNAYPPHPGICHKPAHQSSIIWSVVWWWKVSLDSSQTYLSGSVLLLKIGKNVQCVPLSTEPGISLIILTPMKILQRNLNRSTFVVWEMKRNVSVVCVCSASNCCDTEQRSASQPGSVASGTHCIYDTLKTNNSARIGNNKVFWLLISDYSEIWRSNPL